MEKDESRQSSRLHDIPGHISAFIKTKIAYYKLIAAEAISGAASGAVLGILMLILGVFFLMFLSVAGALGIGYLLDNHAWGFLIIAGVYLLIAIIVFAMKDTLITNPITNAVITKMNAEKASEENINNTNNKDTNAHEQHAYNGYEEPAGRERTA